MKTYKVSLDRHGGISTKPPGYKTFFMLNSAKHEICPANKPRITNNGKLFLAEHILAWKFLC